MGDSSRKEAVLEAVTGGGDLPEHLSVVCSRL